MQDKRYKRPQFILGNNSDDYKKRYTDFNGKVILPSIIPLDALTRVKQQLKANKEKQTQ